MYKRNLRLVEPYCLGSFYCVKKSNKATCEEKLSIVGKKQAYYTKIWLEVSKIFINSKI